MNTRPLKVLGSGVIGAALVVSVVAGCSESRPKLEDNGVDAGHLYDVCSFLTEDDVAPVLGGKFKGVRTNPDPNKQECLWQNPTNYTSVTVNIGLPKSAADNKLIEAPGMQVRPAPGGMQFMSPGVIRFAKAQRENAVAIFSRTPPAPEQLDKWASDLALKIEPKIDEK